MKLNTSTKVRTPRNTTAKVAACATPTAHTAHGACDGTGRTTKAPATPATPVVTRTDADRENSVIAGLATAPSPAKSARAASAARKAAVKAETALPGDAAIRVEGPDGEVTSPKPAKATPKPASPKPTATATVSRKAEMARAMVNALVPVLAGFTPEEQQAAVNMIHHFPTGKTATGARYWPEGILRPDRSDWK
jgi:hypothetical protein